MRLLRCEANVLAYFWQVQDTNITMLWLSDIVLVFVLQGKYQTPPEYENLNDFVNENMSWGGKPSRWKILSVVLWAIVKMRVLVREKHNMMMLYCLLFGDNYEFEREKVVQLWMAAGFIKEEPLEENGNRIFNIFLDRDYIIPSKVNISRQTRLFKVNLELVSDVFARVESIKGFKMSIEDGDVMANQFADSWHISVQSSNINLATFESLKKFGRLKTLLFLNSSLLTRVASDFFSTFKLLTALDLSGSCITELPSTIQDATELRYVDLSWTEINRLPQSIVYLQKLQTLRLKGCMNLFELPERMKELISLRHLDFDVLGQLNLMPRGIGHLTELRTLPAFIVDEEIINGEKCCNIKELKHMNNLSGELCISGLEQLSSEDAQEAALIDKNRLKYLELRWSDVVNYVQEKELVRVLEDLKPNSCLEELKIICFPGESLPNWIGDEQYQKLVSITLYKCENCSNFPYLGRLRKLKNLEIVEMNGVNQIDHFCGDDKNCAAFPLLEKLSIDGMYSVEAITNGNFACLVKLSLSRCPSLTTLSSFPRCQSLKCVEITDCPLLKYLPEEILSSLLESLVIDACPLLSETYSKGGEHSHEIEHVTNVWIELEQTQSSDECSTEDDSSTKGTVRFEVNF